MAPQTIAAASSARWRRARPNRENEGKPKRDQEGHDRPMVKRQLTDCRSRQHPVALEPFELAGEQPPDDEKQRDEGATAPEVST
jgi:hypothetical protein